MGEEACKFCSLKKKRNQKKKCEDFTETITAYLQSIRLIMMAVEKLK